MSGVGGSDGSSDGGDGDNAGPRRVVLPFCRLQRFPICLCRLGRRRRRRRLRRVGKTYGRWSQKKDLLREISFSLILTVVEMKSLF